jgi:hypothetical protein
MMSTLLTLLSLLVLPEVTEWRVAPGGTGSGTAASPFGRIQDALNVAQPGDTVLVEPGTYEESLRTVRGGVPGAPILLRARGARGTVVVTASGRVLTVSHENVAVRGLVLDGQYGADDLLRVSGAAANLELHDLELRRSSRDLIDMANPSGVVISQCLLHHALNPVDGRSDAHGIAAGAVQNLTIRDTEIHTFSGDGVQVDPGRAPPGWNHVTIERSRIWLEPLPAAENGFEAGVVPGENAVDTKASATLPRSTLVIRDTIVHGFRGSMYFSNAAAFNLKEHVEVTVDRVTVSDSEIAFRLRGPNRASPMGAHVAIKNAVVHDVLTAFRYEDDIANLRIWNSTLGANVTRAFQRASSSGSVLDVRNLLVLGSLPSEASHPSNRGVAIDAFIDASRNDYRLAPRSRAIDAGVALSEVDADRVGTSRPQGRAVDVGAYEADANRIARPKGRKR